MIAALFALAAHAGDAYVGLNPLAPLSTLPWKPAAIAVPVLSDMEFGLALSGGHTWTGRHDLQGRLSVGPPHDATFSLVAQADVGWSWFLRAPAPPPDTPTAPRDRGPYVGADVRLWDTVYWTTSDSWWSVLPAAHVGWWFDAGPLYLDLRYTQIVGACSWSSVDGTRPACRAALSPAPEMLPVLPLLGLDVGVRLGPR